MIVQTQKIKVITELEEELTEDLTTGNDGNDDDYIVIILIVIVIVIVIVGAIILVRLCMNKREK